jgi:peptidoglycan/xylan/chitin deacetylase (PgdA/CDA1 family)
MLSDALRGLTGSTDPTGSPTPEPSLPTPSQQPPDSADPTQPPYSAEPVLPSTAANGGTDCRRVKCVALTFDDGPGPYTTTLLRHLAAHHARATFFVVGQSAVAYPDVLRKTAAAGHEIGNHTWSHRDMTRMSGAAIRADLARTDRAIQSVTGVAPVVMRPPYGAFNAAVRKNCKHPVIMWSVDTEDWRYRNPGRVARVAIKHARPGGILLFHDIHPTTVRAMPRVLKALTARGYRFVTVSELLGASPSKVVFSAPSAVG